MRGTAIAVLAGLVMCACGSEQASSTSAPAQTWLVPVAEPAPENDAVVARVNGKPIFASCVKTQAEAHQLSAADAVSECIDFELLAQEAEAAGTQNTTDVQNAAKRELVRRFVLGRYKVQSPEDLPIELVKKLWDRVQARRYNYPELRDIVFCRVPLTPEQGPGSPEYEAGMAFLTSVYQELQLRQGLEQDELFELCWEPHYQEAGVHELALNTFALRAKSGYLPVFREPVFSPPEAGVVIPPIYNRFGIDLILIKKVVKARSTEFAEVEGELREALWNEPIYETNRDGVFEEWYSAFASKRRIEVFPERIPPSAQIVAGGAPTP